MDLVYPVRNGAHDEPEWLRYALRTVEYHLLHDRVFIVGHRPSWIDWDQVTHIPSGQREQRFANQVEPYLSYFNQRANLEVVMASDVSESFLWLNDDFFALRDVETVPFFHRGSLRAYLADLGDGGYAEGLRFCLKLLEAWGQDDPDNYCVHAPLPIKKSRLIEVMERAWSEGLEGGFMRALYPVGLEGNHVQVRDPKLTVLDALPDLDWDWVSTTPTVFRSGQSGAMIRNRYWRKSRYER